MLSVLGDIEGELVSSPSNGACSSKSLDIEEVASISMIGGPSVMKAIVNLVIVKRQELQISC